MSKRLFSLFLGLLLAFLITPQSSSGKSANLRMSTEWPPGDERNALIEKTVVKPFNEVAAGKSKIELYAAGELTKAMSMIDDMDTRLIDLGVTKVTAGWTNVVPALTLLSLPVFDGPNHTYKALTGNLGSYFDQVMQKKLKVKMIGYLTAGETEAMGCVKKQLKAPTDLQGIKLRASSKTDAVSCEAFGAIPTIIDSGEMYLALQRGTVEGVFITTPQGALKLKLLEVCKYWTQSPIVSGIQFGVVANLEVWNGLGKDLQDKLGTFVADLSREMASASRKNADKAWEAIGKTPGANVYVVPVDQVPNWTKVMAPAQLKLLNEVVPSEEATRLLELVQKARN
jgi:C4-dicarboxylate-binding protein DctP